jgi:hypothetical protein
LRRAFGRQIDFVVLLGHARRGQRDRPVGRRAIARLAQRLIGIGLRCGGRRRPDRPARLVADIAGRPQLVGETETRAALAEGRDFQRKLRATGAGTGNRVNPDQFGGLLDRTGLQACDLGLGPPRFTLGGLKQSAAATRQGDKDEGADEIQTNSTRHPRTFGEFI